MHAGFFSFHSSRATIRWLKTESDDIWMFGSPWISGGEPQHCPLSFSPILTETVCTVKCGSPGEIKPHHQLHPSLQDDSLSLMPSIFFCLKKKKKHWIFLSPFSPCSNPSSHISTFFFFFLFTYVNKSPHSDFGAVRGATRKCLARRLQEPWTESACSPNPSSVQALQQQLRNSLPGCYSK